ncbi:MAG: response regulator [Phyllobacteriaceae bacterium]|nr:response regulator [Phyllobacteriaceae bacterium]
MIRSARMPTLMRGLGFARVAAKLRRRPDSEHELTFNRLLLSSAILVYLLIARAAGSTAAAAALDAAALPFLAFEAIAAALFLHILCFPGISHPRRIAGIACDIGIFSYGLHLSGQAGSALFLIYFWAVLGNGFRFGVRYLALAAAAAVVGFAIVVATTPFWQSQTALAAGLIGALVVIPAYTAVLIRKLSEAKRQAEEASRAKSLFLASISHELRTPLNAIIGLSDLLAESHPIGGDREMIDTIGRSGRSLLTLINALLDFSRIEAGKVETKSEDVDLPLLLRQVRDVVGVMARSKGVRVALHVGAHLPRRIVTDRRHLEEILTNLAGNAVKFTAAGMVLVEVDVETTAEGPQLVVAVSDTGIGIAPESQARIFESFTQADGTIIDRFGGTGLGLAIVKQLVDLHGGEIGVVSTPGEGSTFSFHFPVAVSTTPTEPTPLPSMILLSRTRTRLDGLDAPLLVGRDVAEVRAHLAELTARGLRRPIVLVDAAEAPDALDVVAEALLAGEAADEPCLVLCRRAAGDAPSSAALRRLYTAEIDPSHPAFTTLNVVAALSCDRQPTPQAPVVAKRRLSILVADDNKSNQMVIGKILERAGHRVATVDDGEAAVDRMLAEPFDLVLMDVNMPVMNGIEATKFYRFAALGTRLVPIVALTADATAEAESRCREAGMAACLTKPIDAAELIAAIELLVGDAPPQTLPAVAAPAEPTETVDDEAPAIDGEKLSDLEALGGRAFVDELISTFTDEATRALRALGAAVADEDVAAFRNHAHALRSGAANIGALRVYRMCLDWRRIDARELAVEGERHIHDLERAFAEVRAAIAQRDGEANGSAADPFAGFAAKRRA